VWLKSRLSKCALRRYCIQVVEDCHVSVVRVYGTDPTTTVVWPKKRLQPCIFSICLNGNPTDTAQRRRENSRVTRPNWWTWPFATKTTSYSFIHSFIHSFTRRHFGHSLCQCISMFQVEVDLRGLVVGTILLLLDITELFCGPYIQ